MFVMPRAVRFTEDQLRAAISESVSWAETLRRLQYRSAGGNWRTLQKYAALWSISAEHFDPDAARRESLARARGLVTPLAEVMVRDSSYTRSHLKRRLFDEGLKERCCEFCGQDESWRGRQMALILDHINGVANDHRLENLRILCPNCASTLETHCGRKNRLPVNPTSCARCGIAFLPKRPRQRYCSQACGQRWDRSGLVRGRPRLTTRRVERPHYQQLLAEIEQTSYSAVGRKYGVSDNAIRKWVRSYENELERQRRDRLGDEEEEK